MFTIKSVKAMTFAFSFAAIAVVVLAMALPASAHGSTRGDFDRVRSATGKYFDLDLAKGDGYALLKDAAGIACIDSPGVGAMGVHYANGELIGSGVIDPLKPQVLVYAPGPNGRLSLAAVEYVVFQEAWDAANPQPPVLFGEQFMLTPAGNRFGLPAYYALHVWIWEKNSRGVFSMWNPRVHCRASAEGDYN